jgi:hypothetical protein
VRVAVQALTRLIANVNAVKRATLIALALAALLLAPAAAGNAYDRVFQAYSSTGMVSACQFSAATLESALKTAPTLDQEYDADFTDAVQSAISAQAGGACRSGKNRLKGLKLGLGGYGNTSPPGSITSPTGAGIPLPLAILLALVAAALLVALAVGVARALGFDPPWAQAALHALRETEYRLSDRLPVRPQAPTGPPRRQLPPGRGAGELGRRSGR